MAGKPTSATTPGAEELAGQRAVARHDILNRFFLRCIIANAYLAPNRQEKPMYVYWQNGNLIFHPESDRERSSLDLLSTSFKLRRPPDFGIDSTPRSSLGSQDFFALIGISDSNGGPVFTVSENDEAVVGVEEPPKIVSNLRSIR